jgi:hypothetical protein
MRARKKATLSPVHEIALVSHPMATAMVMIQPRFSYRRRSRISPPLIFRGMWMLL